MLTKRLVLIVALVCIAAGATYSAVPPMISYQGRLTQPSGAPVADGTYSMLFSIYDVPTGGTPLWSETNPSVQVKGGLFATMLGSVVNIPANIFDSPNRFFAVKVGSDPEMTPRQQVASSAFAFRAATVDDGAITASKLADSAVTATKLADSAVTASKLADGVAIPPGTIVMWSGAVGSIPHGWALCDGASGSPDLRDKFIVGAGAAYAVGATGGEATHTLAVAEMPSHSHRERSANTSGYGGADGVPSGTGYSPNYHLSDVNVENTGGGQAHENRPPYYALCYIMKLAY